MKIKKLRLQNFKSFASLDIDLNIFSVIVGANATGKSNLISAFRFIKNIMMLGIDNAIALHGGIQNIINSRCPKGSMVTVSFEIDFSEDNAVYTIKKEKLGLGITCLNYSFSIIPHKRGQGYSISNDELSISYKCYESNLSPSTRTFEEKYTDLKTIFNTKYLRKTHKSNVVYTSKLNTTVGDKILSERDIDNNFDGNFFCDFVNRNKNELMLYRLPILLPPNFSEKNFINIYDFDPKMLKHSCSISSIKELEENGSNMAAVLQHLLKSKENRKELTTLLSNALPFVSNIGIESNLDQSYSFKIGEKYSKKMYYANFLSDGTVSVMAIIIALYFERLTEMIILEEPERNIHPMLLQKIVEMAKDVSNDKQVIFTTHNAEIIRNVSLESIIFIKRDDNGNSFAIRPSDSKAVQCFLENDLGVDDLFLQNLLGE